MLEKDAQPEKDPNNINSHISAVVLRENNSHTKSSGTCGTLAAGPKGVNVKQEPIEIMEVDSDSGDFEIVDSQLIPGKSVQTKSACNTQTNPNIPACPTDQVKETLLGQCTNTMYNAKSSKKIQD